jgi:hypothetical protein
MSRPAFEAFGGASLVNNFLKKINSSGIKVNIQQGVTASEAS